MEPTICIECQYYKAGREGSEIQSAVPALCLAGSHLIERRNYVTGETWREWNPDMVECSQKNGTGHCSDYKFKQLEPRKHWWNRFDGPPMDVYPDRERKK